MLIKKNTPPSPPKINNKNKQIKNNQTKQTVKQTQTKTTLQNVLKQGGTFSFLTNPEKKIHL